MAHSTICDIFSQNYVWTDLRKLSLRYFHAEPAELLSLLERHSATLRDLRLHAIHLASDNSGKFPTTHWPGLLREANAVLQLEKATVSGYLRMGSEQSEWDLEANRTLAATTSRYLVEGGECPLHTEDTVACSSTILLNVLSGDRRIMML